jgi:hypothetical protein
MTPLILTQIGTGILVPACATGSILLAAQLLKPGANRFVIPLALAIGFLAGYVATFGAPLFPPRESGQWLPWITLAAAACALLPLTPRWRSVALGLLVTGLIIHRHYELEWLSANFPWLKNGAQVFFILALNYTFAASLQKFTDGPPSAWTPFALMIFLCTVSLTIALSGSAALGQAAGILTATLGALWILHLWRPIEPASATTAILATLVPAFLLLAYFYADLPATCGLILLAAPAGACVAAHFSPKKLKAKSPAFARALVISFFGLIAVALAWYFSPALEY